MPLQNETWPNTEPLRPLTQRPWASAFAVAPTWVRSVPLKPTSMVTMARAGRVGTTGAAAGVVPWVITSGSYTDSAPVAGFRMVACTNAPSAAALAMLQPDAAGVIPFGPVSCHGVARPCALSGLAGTMMLQFMLVVAAAAVAVGLAVADAVVHGVAAAVAAVVAAVVAAAVAAAVEAAVGAAAVGAVTAPVGVGAAVGAAAAAVAAAVAAVAAAAVPAAVLAADGVAQAATLALLLALNTLLTPGTSSATPTPATTATTPPIARSRVRDRGSNSRSWLKTLLRYDTTPFPFNRVSLPVGDISPATEPGATGTKIFRSRPVTPVADAKSPAQTGV